MTFWRDINKMVLDGSPSVEVLRVVLVADKDTGEKKFAWKFGNGNINLYMLIGVLENIKHDLLEKLHKQTFYGRGE